MWNWLLGEEKRATAETVDDMDAMLRGQTYKSNVTREQALEIPAVHTAVNTIINLVSSMPLYLYRRNNGEIECISDDYRLNFFNQEANEYMDGRQLIKALLMDVLIEGVGYIYIERTGNTINSLIYVPKSKVIATDNNMVLNRMIKIMIEGKTIENHELMRVTLESTDGIKGRGLLDNHNVILSTMYNALRYENATMANGGKKGFLKAEGKLEETAMMRLKQAWQRLFSNDANDVIVLNKGISFEPANQTAVENQLNENKKTNTELMYSLFGLTNKVFTNDEAFKVFYKTSVMPLITAISCALNKYLLLESEKTDYFFAFDSSKLLQADIQTRYQSYDIALKSGWILLDEVRKREKLPALGLNFVKFGLDSVFYDPQTSMIYTPNTDKTGNLLSMKGGENNAAGNTE